MSSKVLGKRNLDLDNNDLDNQEEPPLKKHKSESTYLFVPISIKNLIDFSQDMLECIFQWVEVYDLISLIKTTKQFECIKSSDVLCKNIFKHLSRKYDVKHPAETDWYVDYENIMRGYRSNYINYLLQYHSTADK
eukprot:379836_1